MILNCENCDTRYLLSARLLGPDGRRVRCSHCGHEWYQDPPDDSYAAAMADVDPIPEGVKPVPDGSELPVLPEFNPAEEEQAAYAAHSHGWLGYAGAAAVLLLALAVGFVFSTTMVRVWPQSVALYELARMGPQLPGETLVVDRVRAEVVTGEGGMNMLQVQGFVLNLTRGVMAVPPLRVLLRRDGGEVIDTWLIAPTRPALDYEEEFSFMTTYPVPPTDSREVTVRLEPFSKVKVAE